MADKPKSDAKWKKFLSEEEKIELDALEGALSMYTECAKETRAAIKVLRDKHAWKLRKTNPYKGGSNEDTSD